MTARGPVRRAPLIAIALIGVGLVLAPFAFRMFERGPEGAVMIDEFQPFMTEERVEGFQGHMALIDAAVAEGDAGVRAHLAEEADIDDGVFDEQFASFVAFAEVWPAIEADMGDLLTKVNGNVNNYEAVAALPPFGLFPWFFVVPGLLVAVFALVGLRTGARRWATVLAGLGVALVLAPAVFGMFTRAPAGGEMMDDFETFMVRERVQTIQGYFGTMSSGEGGIRLGLVPALAESGLSPDEIAARFPAVAELREAWVGIVGDMTPMIGAMSDNVDNYDAVAALPPFPLFPWFFVVPGVLIAVLALVARRRPQQATDPAVVRSPRSAEAAERKPDMSSHFRTPRLRLMAPLLALVLVAGACGGDDGGGEDASDNNGTTDTTSAPTETSAPETTSGELVGTFAIDAGACDDTGFTGGSYLQLVLPGGSVEAGPWFENPDSTCGDTAFTLVEAGADGGLVTGDYQPAPEPAFDATGNSLADGVIQPTGFAAIAFSISSNPTDPQTGTDVQPPTITVNGEELSGNVSAVTASWSNEFFNQGSPKPDGSAPGLTSEVTGTYDAVTGEFVLEWASQIVGGPFNDFTGVWHLEGTFEAAS